MSKFKKEHRYYVIKRKHLKDHDEGRVINLLNSLNLPDIDCVVIESDWPEYAIAWKMIEDRVNGNPNEIQRLAQELAALREQYKQDHEKWIEYKNAHKEELAERDKTILEHAKFEDLYYNEYAARCQLEDYLQKANERIAELEKNQYDPQIQGAACAKMGAEAMMEIVRPNLEELTRIKQEFVMVPRGAYNAYADYTQQHLDDIYNEINDFGNLKTHYAEFLSADKSEG